MPDDPRDHPFGRRDDGHADGADGPANGHANGHEPEGMGTDPVPLDDVREPLDLVAVQADDELINALSAGLAVSAPGVHGYDADDHVAAMLAAWKADVESEPIPQIDLDTAVDAVLAGSRPAARRPSTRMRHLVPVASAAALVVVAITGVSIAAHDTRPGDALFPVSKVLYAEEARSYEALDVVHYSRERAREALAHGDKAGAEVALAQGQVAAESVLAEHGRGEVEQKLHKLQVVVNDSEPGVPTVVEEDKDKPSGGSGSSEPSGSSSSSSQSSESSQSSDPSENPSSAASGSSEPTQPGQEPSDRPGTEEPDSSTTSGPGTSAPESKPTTSQPDPRAADAPPPGQGEQTSSSPPSEPARPQPTTKEPTATEPSTHTSSSHSSPSAEPAPTTNEPPATTSDDPTKPHSSAQSSRTKKQPGTGISGASMSATGTATPSGEPEPTS